MDKALWPDRNTEKARYLEHHNVVEDPRFQAFVAPITQHIFHYFSPQHTGLDFGAGHAPVISHVLQKKGYNVASFDPLFFNEQRLLNRTYDYICSCEVIEHFHHPADSFALLRTLLNPQGQLLCMTEIYHEGIDFHQWNYKNDPTHVFMYHRKTLSYIADRYGFKKPVIDGRFVVFSL
ncbi:class I SAM-dependent methyltransferase [Methylophaga sp.]|uniref:class I SAM-dependent methyltransferase n=1 Tax=Methylophaga sp. TaxID=2024840 RepID=UPI003F69C027